MSQLKDVFGNNSPGPGADTFLGLPACDDLSQLEAAVAIVGAPIATPYPSFGTYVALSPTAIRAATNDYAAMVGHHDFEISDSLHDDQFGPVVDAGDLATSEADFAGNRVMITGAVKQILHAGAAPIVLGGDDSVPIPVFKAFESCGPYPILQIDAHIDWRDEVNGQRIDLFTRRIFSKHATPKKDPSARSVCPDCGEINPTRFDANSVHCPTCSTTYNPQDGNIKGAVVTCDYCLHQFRLVDRMKSTSEPLPIRRYAKMILTRDGQKRYEKMNEFDGELEARIANEYEQIAGTFPAIEIQPGYNTNQILKHNYSLWYQLFSDRQLVCIGQMIDAIKGIEQPNQKLLFATLFSGTLEFNNLFTSFKGEGTGAVRHMFSHHILKPEMMPIEANLWGTSKSSGAFSTLFKSRVQRSLAYKSDPFELKISSSGSKKIGGINQPINVEIVDDFDHLKTRSKSVYISVGDSSSIELPDQSIDLVVTDPPFFDNVHYSQLADFFYYWLNQILEISPSATTRTENEVQDTDADLFTNKLTSVFSECNRVLREGGLFIFTYHHSRHDGWTAIHQAIRQAGFICTQAYPIKAEMSVSMPLRQAKSPIHLDLILVCRKDYEKSFAQPHESSIISVLEKTKLQVVALKNAGINVSLGDTKVALMGQFLCEAHKLRNLVSEEQFLKELERDIDSYVEQVILTEGEILYNVEKTEFQQLQLFEDMAQYLVKKDYTT